MTSVLAVDNNPGQQPGSNQDETTKTEKTVIEHYMLPPGQYDLTLTYTTPDGEKQKIQLPNLYASDMQQIDIEVEDTDVYRDGGDVLMSVPDPGSRELRLDFTADVLADDDGAYLRIERPVSKWRVTYTYMGTRGWMDFTNEVDAKMFMEQGYESGMFITPELVEVRP